MSAGISEAEIYQARERLGLFNVTLQSPFTTWLWAQSERRKHMTEVERLKTELMWEKAVRTEALTMVVVLEEALTACVEELDSAYHDHFDGVWPESRFERVLAPYHAALRVARPQNESQDASTGKAAAQYPNG